MLVVLSDALDKLVDGLWLIALGLVLGDKVQRDAAFGLVRPGRAVGLPFAGAELRPAVLDEALKGGDGGGGAALGKRLGFLQPDVEPGDGVEAGGRPFARGRLAAHRRAARGAAGRGAPLAALGLVLRTPWLSAPSRCAWRAWCGLRGLRPRPAHRRRRGSSPPRRRSPRLRCLPLSRDLGVRSMGPVRCAIRTIWHTRRAPPMWVRHPCASNRLATRRSAAAAAHAAVELRRLFWNRRAQKRPRDWQRLPPSRPPSAAAADGAAPLRHARPVASAPAEAALTDEVLAPAIALGALDPRLGLEWEGGPQRRCTRSRGQRERHQRDRDQKGQCEAQPGTMRHHGSQRSPTLRIQRLRIAVGVA